MEQNRKAQYSYVFFDYFDTIMCRDCTPQKIKCEWSKIITRTFDMHISADTLYEMRRKTEEYLERAQTGGNGEYTYEQFCNELYNKLQYCHLISDISLDDFKRVAYDVELETEIKHQYINKEIAPLLEKFRKDRCIICCVSDFYMPEVFIRTCMKEKKIDTFFSYIFVSCDYMVNKRGGDLYDIVFEKLNADPSICLMVGDNYTSDYLKAKEKGCDAKLVQNKISGKAMEKQKYIQIRRQMNLLYRKSKKTGVPYGSYGFSLFYFIDNLFCILMRKEVDNVFFLSREGEMLKKLFDIYQKINFGKQIINSNYLYVSRLSTFTASLNPDIEQEDFNSLLRQYNYISIENFLRSIGWSDDKINRLASIVNIDVSAKVRNFGNSKEFEYLKSVDFFRKTYKMIVNEQKEYLLTYLESFGIDYKAKGIHIVDVGWKGSMQDNLSKLLNNVPIFGYYVGLSEGGTLSCINTKKGILYDDIPLPSQYDYIWKLDNSFFERILYASHGSVQAYALQEGKINPVLKIYPREKELKEFVLPTQHQIEYVFSDLCENFKNAASDSSDMKMFFVWLHLKTCLGMTKKEFQFQKRMLDGHIENFALFTYGRIDQKLTLLKTCRILRGINSETLLPYIIKLIMFLYSHDIPVLGIVISRIIEIYYYMILRKEFYIE